MEIVSAIVTSFIASVVFYLCFQYLPEKRRYNRIRPRIEVELMEITDSLFFYIEMPLRHEIHSSSFFQKEIREGKLVKEDFELGLYNKCLNDSYVYDENSNLMIVIGDKLKYHADQLSLGIRNVLMSQQFLTSDEILIIEDINRLLYIEHAKAHLERIIKDRKRERLVYERGFFECIEGNKELMSLCSKLCSEDEIAEWNNVVGQEKRIKDHFIKQNNYLKDYYENKTKGKSV